MNLRVPLRLRPARGWRGIIVCGALAFAQVLAQEPSQYSTRLWQMEDGLPHNIVQAIAQSQDGYLWVGTREGLARFDGVRFQVVELLPEIRHPSVLSLIAGPDGSLWVGTEDAGLFQVRSGAITRWPSPDGRTNYAVYELHRSAAAIWLASSVGVLEWNGGVLRRRADFRNLIESLCVNPAGDVWHAGDGLRRLSTSPTNYVVRTGHLPREVRKVYCEPDGTFWLATANRGLTRLKDGAATYYHKAEGPAGFVSVMRRDHAGAFWVGSYSGLSRLTDRGFVNESEPHSLSYQVYAVAEDREGCVWVGSEEGLTRFTRQAFRTYTTREGLTLNRVVTVCASRDGSVWAGLHGGGLNRFVDGRIVPFRAADGLSSDYVMAQCEARDGSLWVGTDYGSTLNRIRAGQVVHHGREQGYVTAATTALVEDAAGTIWAGTRDGLYRFHDGRFTCHLTDDGLSHNKVNALCLNRDGGLWIGTDDGLSQWTQGRFTDLSARVRELKTPILSLHEDAADTLWIGTRGNGLWRWRNGARRTFSNDEGLSSDSIYSVLEDDRGNLWLNGSRGIFRVSKSELEAVAAGRQAHVNSIAYGKADGIISSGQYREVTQPAACKSSDGRLWFRTTQGVAVVNPNQIATNEQPPPVVIEEIVADRKSIAGTPPLPVGARVTVPRGRRALEIRYTALSLRAPERNRFRYRLEGVDPNWVEAGIRRSAYYNKVAPGEYRFLVTACNNDGVWNETGDMVELSLPPYFWETRWFLTLCVLAAIGAVAGSVAWVTRSRMRRAMERLEQQHAIERERTRIARDMHDELGAKLTRISFQGAMAKRNLAKPAEVAPQIEQMAQTARELVSSLDEIVWAVNPENDSLENLANYLCHYASAFLESSPVTCEFLIPPHLPPIRLGSDVRHHVFLATKEALTNVLKHAGANRVQIRVSARAAEFEIVIADDGVGLAGAVADASASANTGRTGQGLANMRSRLTAVSGHADISSPGRGTRVRFTVPVEAAASAAVSSIHPTDRVVSRRSY